MRHTVGMDDEHVRVVIQVEIGDSHEIDKDLFDAMVCVALLDAATIWAACHRGAGCWLFSPVSQP